jgi:aromatic-amino-acid transaminase
LTSTVNPAFASTLIPSAAGRAGDDPIFALNAEAQRRAAAGEAVINATLGALMEDDGSLAVIPSVIEALARVPIHKAAAYAPISGDASFLAAVIADVYGASPLAAQTVAAATPGGTGALYHALTNFLEPGQALLTTSYFWGPYQTIATHTGRRLETFEMFAPGGGFHLAAFEEALGKQIERQGRALVFLNSPCHNPTGYSLDEREWEALADIVQRAGERAPVALLVDLAYARFGSKASHGWTRHVPRMSSSATVLVAWSASKSFAQYGARVGALLATSPDAAERTRIANALSFACRGTWSNCNHGGLLAIAELLSEPKLRARADTEREHLIRLLDERVSAFNREAAKAGLSYPRYEGGFFVSVFTGEPEKAAAKLREEGVFVVPLKEKSGGALRVALCSTPVKDVPRLVAALGRATKTG